MRAVITVTGIDATGIIAKVSKKCEDYKVNIVDITQSVLDKYFAMTMLVETTTDKFDFSAFVDSMTKLGEDMGMDVHTMHEDIFNSMHKI